jgi:hypothetical protein
LPHPIEPLAQFDDQRHLSPPAHSFDRFFTQKLVALTPDLFHRHVVPSRHIGYEKYHASISLSVLFSCVCNSQVVDEANKEDEESLKAIDVQEPPAANDDQSADAISADSAIADLDAQVVAKFEFFTHQLS